MVEYKQFVIWGASGHAKVLADLIGQRGGSVIALFDNNPNSQTCLPGVPLFYGETGFYTWLSQQRSVEGVAAAIAIGGYRSGSDRALMASRFEAAGISLPTLIHPDATVSPTARLGKGTQILARAVVAADAALGDVCIVNNTANVDHECRLGNGVHIAPGAVLCGCVTIEDNVFVGAGSVILPRLHISGSALIGAGAVITKNISAGDVVAGNPARPMPFSGMGKKLSKHLKT
jgi:sugar O-acyltransferase (sialic acid O-acetyltransferase NeuD family)